MATSFVTEIPVIVYSSDLHEIELRTDLDRVKIGLYVDGDYGDEIYNTTLYQISGEIVIRDLNSIVELYMRANKASFKVLTLSCFDLDGNTLCETNLNVMYCFYKLPVVASVFCSSFFLTTLTSKRTYPHSTELLSFLANCECDDMKAHCVYKNAQGQTLAATVILINLGYEGLCGDTVKIKYDEIVTLLRQQGCEVDSLIAYTIEWGQRTMTYYVHNLQPNICLTFRNCFNVPETVQFNAVTTTKSKVERSISMAKSRYSFYDQTTEKTYEVQSSPLTEQETQWIEQLAMSLDVRMGVADDILTLPSVLITESTIEMVDSNAELNRIKFTWRYDDPQAHNNTIAIPEDRIHTEEFTYQYN